MWCCHLPVVYSSILIHLLPLPPLPTTVIFTYFVSTAFCKVISFTVVPSELPVRTCVEQNKARKIRNQNLFVNPWQTLHMSNMIFHLRGSTFHLSYPYWTVYLIIRKYNKLNHCDRAQININSDKNITQWLLFSFQAITSWQTMV